MKALSVLILFSISYCLTISNNISFNNKYDIISATYNGSSRYYILDYFGFVFAIDSSGNKIAEIDPSKNGLFNPTDIDFSSGYLFIADPSARAIFITDSYLRTPTKISLFTSNNEPIAPSKIAISSGRSALIWDADRGSLFFTDNIVKQSPLYRLSCPIAKDGVNDIIFDRLLKSFVIIMSGRAIIITPNGIVDGELTFDGIKSPIAGFEVDSGFAVFSEDSMTIFDGENWHKMPAIHCKVVIQSFSGEPFFFDSNSITFGKLSD